MTDDIVDIDHLMLSVQSSDLAMDVFSRMGFTITPRGVLEGLSNRLICFAGANADAPNFVEFMSLDDAQKAPPAMAQALKIPDRPVLLVAATNSAENTRNTLSEAGMEVSPVIDTGRDWKLPSGEVLDLTFSIVLPTPGQAPFYWIACQHKTPQHYLRDDFISHANGGIALKNIIAIAKDPVAAAGHYQQNWNAEVFTVDVASDRYAIVKRGHVELHIYSRNSFHDTYPSIVLKREENHIVGFTASVKDLGQVTEKLDQNGFSPVQIGGGILVDPSQACGCLVVFENATN